MHEEGLNVTLSIIELKATIWKNERINV